MKLMMAAGFLATTLLTANALAAHPRYEQMVFRGDCEVGSERAKTFCVDNKVVMQKKETGSSVYVIFFVKAGREVLSFTTQRVLRDNKLVYRVREVNVIVNKKATPFAQGGGGFCDISETFAACWYARGVQRRWFTIVKPLEEGENEDEEW